MCEIKYEQQMTSAPGNVWGQVFTYTPSIKCCADTETGRLRAEAKRVLSRFLALKRPSHSEEQQARVALQVLSGAL